MGVIQLLITGVYHNIVIGALAKVNPGLCDFRKSLGRPGRNILDKESGLSLFGYLIYRNPYRAEAVGEPKPLIDKVGRGGIQFFFIELTWGKRDRRRLSVNIIFYDINVIKGIVIADSLKLIYRFEGGRIVNNPDIG